MIRRAPLLLLALALTACDDDSQCGPYDPTVQGYEMMAPTKADLIRLRAQTPTKLQATEKAAKPAQAKAAPEKAAPEEVAPEEAANKGRPGTGVTMFPADYAFPKEEIFPVTEKIHELISQKDSPSKAEEMKPYELKIAPVPDYGINMIPLPGGEVTLGSPEGEEDREDDEEQRTVKVEPFWMASTETTWALYIEFMDNGKPRNKGGTLDLDTDRNTQEAPDVDGDAPLVDVVSQPTPPYTGMHFNMGEGGYDNA
jgi:formylglycine-generating enzyme required for sulfatase activity